MQKNTIPLLTLLLGSSALAQNSADMIGAPEFTSSSWNTYSVPSSATTWKVNNTSPAYGSYGAETMFIPNNYRTDLSLSRQGDGGQYLLQFTWFADGYPQDSLLASCNGITIASTYGGAYHDYTTFTTVINSLSGANNLVWSFYHLSGNNTYPKAYLDSVIWAKIPPTGLPVPQLTAQLTSDGTVIITWPYPSVGYTPIASSDLVNWVSVVGERYYLSSPTGAFWAIKVLPQNAVNYMFYTLKRQF
jgi:hypothetical protein